MFTRAAEEGGRVRAVVAPGCSGFSRKEIDELVELAKVYRAKGLVALKVEGGGLHGSGSKHIDPTAQKALIERPAQPWRSALPPTRPGFGGVPGSGQEVPRPQARPGRAR